MGRLEMVMCRACGHFEEVTENDGELEVLNGECGGCGGKEFKYNGTREVIRAE